MGDGKITLEMTKFAQQRASAYAPLPKHEPLTAGMVGLFVAVVISEIFILIAGLEGDFKMALAWTALIGFVAPFLYMKRQEKQHWRAYAREMQMLRESKS